MNYVPPALVICLLKLLFPIGFSQSAFGQETETNQESLSSGDGYRVLERFVDSKHQIPKKYYREMFKKLNVPRGQGIATFCIDKKVFAIGFSNLPKLVVWDQVPVSHFSAIRSNTKRGLSIEQCDNNDYEMLGFVMIPERKFSGLKEEVRAARSPRDLVKVCIKAKVFYLVPTRSNARHERIIQSISNGRAEEC